MLCRRCMSNRLLRLAVMHPADNPVLRCLECGFLFSPAALTAVPQGANRGRPGFRNKAGANPGTRRSVSEPESP